MTKGDRQTLSREAEAIAALATERLALAACRSCGTQISDESHFCRRCGAPLVIDVPELEVLRLTRGTRGSYHNMFVGILMMLCAALTLLPIFIVNGTRIYTPLLVIGIPFAVYGLFLLLQGLWQLHRTLNPRAAETNPVERGSIQPAANTKSLTAPAHGTSITEGTTELLFPSLPHREPEPVRRRDVDTGEINADRLM